MNANMNLRVHWKSPGVVYVTLTFLVLLSIQYIIGEMKFVENNTIAIKSNLELLKNSSSFEVNNDTLISTNNASDVRQENVTQIEQLHHGIAIAQDGNATARTSINIMNEHSNDDNLHTTTGELNVTIAMKFPRKDRLGSNVQRPLFLMAYSYCKGYNFCIGAGRAGIASIFGFPTCPDNIVDVHVGTIFETEVNRSGSYSFSRDDGAVMAAVADDIECALAASTRKIWRDMIFSAPQYHDPNSITVQNLFGNTTAVTVAVHIRRGDIGLRHPVSFPDEFYVFAIKELQDRLTKIGREVEVHIFSEDYGDTNWTAYEGLVDKEKMHLAPRYPKEGGMDMDLNLRDWKHFITADILIVGGSFSSIASLARDDPDEMTGLPLTINICKSSTLCSKADTFSWSGVFLKHNVHNLMGAEFLNLPSALT